MLVFLIFSTSCTYFGLRPKLGCTSAMKIKISFYFALLSVCTNFADWKQSPGLSLAAPA